MSLVSITAYKKDHIVYPSGKVMSIEANNVKMAFTKVTGAVEMLIYDENRAKLTYIQTTTATDINAIFAAMTSPYLAKIDKIGATTVTKPALIDYSSVSLKTGSGLETLYYNYGRSAKKITAYLNDGATTVAITGVSAANNTFTVATDLTATFVAGYPFRVDGSTGNDKLYSVKSSSFGGGNTTITVNEDVTDATADGNIKI